MAGSSNENPDNLAEDLAVANTEIEQLRALLESQETLTSETETLIPDGLVGILQALSQCLSRVDDAPAIWTKSAKIPDPPILTDRKTQPLRAGSSRYRESSKSMLTTSLLMKHK